MWTVSLRVPACDVVLRGTPAFIPLLNFEALITWPQHTRQGNALLLCRFLQQTFVQVAGGKLEIVNVNCSSAFQRKGA